MSNAFREKRYSALTGLIAKKGGTIVDRSYSVLRKPIAVRCREGHRFRVTSKNLMRGSWCVQCRPVGRQTEYLESAKSRARKQGGKCLSATYKNAREWLKWKCAAGHTWEATFDNVVNKNSWCPTCSVKGASDRKTRWWRSQKLNREHRRRTGK